MFVAGRNLFSLYQRGSQLKENFSCASSLPAQHRKIREIIKRER